MPRIATLIDHTSAGGPPEGRRRRGAPTAARRRAGPTAARRRAGPTTTPGYPANPPHPCGTVCEPACARAGSRFRPVRRRCRWRRGTRLSTGCRRPRAQRGRRDDRARRLAGAAPAAWSRPPGPRRGRRSRSRRVSFARARSTPTAWSSPYAPTARSAARQNVYVKDGRVDPDRGRPRRAAQPRAAVPEGLGHTAADDWRRARAPRALSPRRTRPSGSDLDLETAMDMVAERVVQTRARRLGVGGRRQAHAALHEHRRAGRGDARQRGELPDQEAAHGPGSDPDREPGARVPLLDGGRAWALPSAVAPRARCPATCRTPT